MTQLVKAARLRSIPGTHMLEEEKQLLNIPLTSGHQGNECAHAPNK